MWKLVAPHTRKDGKKIEFYYVRGKYLGIALDKSTGTAERRAAQTILSTWRKQAERGEFSKQPEKQVEPDYFVAAANAYMDAGGERKYINPIITQWKTRLLSTIDQIAIDTLARELYPDETAATRNRQVHTPVSAILKHVGIERKIRRPKGWKGKKSTSWLEPEQAFALFNAADGVEPEFGLLCRFLLYTGMRLGEALSRKVRHLNLERSFIYLEDSKNGEPRGCHLPAILVDSFMSQPARVERKLIERGQRGFIIGGGGRAVVDAGAPFLDRSPDAKLFRYHDGGPLRIMLKSAMRTAGLSFPRRQGGFHLFSHSYGTWMHRYGGLDAHALTRTGRWSDPDSADRYVHTEASKEAKMSDIFPTPATVLSLPKARKA